MAKPFKQKIFYKASPCKASWEIMKGGDTVRVCPSCQCNVYKIATIPKEKALEIVQEKETICPFFYRFYQRKDGTLLTQNCSVGKEILENAKKHYLFIYFVFIITFLGSWFYFEFEYYYIHFEFNTTSLKHSQTKIIALTTALFLLFLGVAFWYQRIRKKEILKPVQISVQRDRKYSEEISSTVRSSQKNKKDFFSFIYNLLLIFLISWFWMELLSIYYMDSRLPLQKPFYTTPLRSSPVKVKTLPPSSFPDRPLETLPPQRSTPPPTEEVPVKKGNRYNPSQKK
jgi:hypothetical protein